MTAIAVAAFGVSAQASERVTLRNGTGLQCHHHAAAGSRVRFFLSADENDFLEVEASEIVAVETAIDPRHVVIGGEKAPSPLPATVPARAQAALPPVRAHLETVADLLPLSIPAVKLASLPPGALLARWLSGPLAPPVPVEILAELPPIPFPIVTLASLPLPATPVDRMTDLPTGQPPVAVVAETRKDAEPAMPTRDEDATLSQAELHQLLVRAGREHNLDVDLLFSIVSVESGGKTRARSPAGAVGLMQLTSVTAADLGVDDRTRPEENIRGGSAYLAGLLARYHDNLALALAAYNAGPTAVDKYNGIPPYAVTRAYVNRVIREFKRRVLLREAEAHRPAAGTSSR